MKWSEVSIRSSYLSMPNNTFDYIFDLLIFLSVLFTKHLVIMYNNTHISLLLIAYLFYIYMYRNNILLNIYLGNWHFENFFISLHHLKSYLCTRLPMYLLNNYQNYHHFWYVTLYYDICASRRCVTSGAESD